MKKQKGKVLRILGLVGLFILVFGLSYALFRITLIGTKATRVNTANFKLELLDENNNSIEKTSNNSYEYEIELESAYPISDEEGYEQASFIFKVKNSGDVPVEYTLYLDDEELSEGEERISDNKIKYSLKEDDLGGGAKLLSTLTERRLDHNIINPKKERKYELRVWIDYDAGTEISGKVFDTVLRVEGSQYESKIKIEKGSFAETLVNEGIIDRITYVRDGFNSSKEQSGLYEYMDSEGARTYVYRGMSIDNYVYFAGSIWRVLRIQEDGTIKLIKEEPLNFESDRVASSGETYKLVKYNITGYDRDSKYAGSNIEGYVNEWYEAEMGEYDDKIATNTYCSDRAEDHFGKYYIWKNRNRGTSSLYGISNRIDFGFWLAKADPTTAEIKNVLVIPSISCREADEVNTRAALITADESSLAGESLLLGATNYLFNNVAYWTMSPNSFYYDRAMATQLSAWGIRGRYVNDPTPIAVRPVITLKSDVKIESGLGTSDKPYVIN